MDPTDTSTDDAPTQPPFKPMIPEWDGHDMLTGPCSCGATHYPGDIEVLAAAAVKRQARRELAAASMGHTLAPGDIELMVADRLAEFRVNVLASLGLDASDLRTLRSVLDGQLVCEHEAAETMPKRAPLPLTVRRAMTLAADTGAVVKLRLRFRGETVEHVCRVSPDSEGWSVDPGMVAIDWSGNPRLRQISSRVVDESDAGNDLEQPVVVSCEPVPKGLAIVPEGEFA